MKLERKDDEIHQEITFAFHISGKEMDIVAKSPATSALIVQMAQIPMISSQLSALVEIASAIERAEADAELKRMREDPEFLMKKVDGDMDESDLP